MSVPAHLEAREILHPAVLAGPSGHNVLGVDSSGDDDRVSQGDAAGIPVIKILVHLILFLIQNSVNNMKNTSAILNHVIVFFHVL